MERDEAAGRDEPIDDVAADPPCHELRPCDDAVLPGSERREYSRDPDFVALLELRAGKATLTADIAVNVALLTCGDRNATLSSPRSISIHAGW
jgi:hypothetical protein